MAFYGHRYRSRTTPRHLKERWLYFWDRMERACARMDFGDFGMGERDENSSATSELTRAELIEKLAKVEERLEVLERIVTNKGYNVADEINQL